ncbi:hypothetical protein E4T43_08940, partial [Aureobasidium subglaciale]
FAHKIVADFKKEHCGATLLQTTILSYLSLFRSSLSSTFLSFSIAHLALLLVFEGEIDINCTCLSPTSCSCSAVWHLRTTISLSRCSTFEHVFKAHPIVHSSDTSRLSASSDAVGQVDLVITTSVSIATIRCQVIAAASKPYSNLTQTCSNTHVTNRITAFDTFPLASYTQ